MYIIFLLSTYNLLLLDMDTYHIFKSWGGILEVKTVTTDFTTHGGSHFYGLPCPSTDSLDPMDLYYTLMIQYYLQKTPIYTYMQLLKQ